jgi:HK97 family phage major capsid protein
MSQLFTREHRIEKAQSVDGEDLIVNLAMASEKPYERWWGIEVLKVEENTVRLDRLNDGASVLFNHNWDDLRGVHVENSVRADEDKVLRGQVLIESATQKGRETASLILKGILTKSSVGYAIHKVVEKSTTKDGKTHEREIQGHVFERLIRKLDDSGQRDRGLFVRELDRSYGPVENRADDDVPTYYIVDWEPHENSFVTVPADISVGVDRSAVPRGATANVPPPKSAQAATPKEITMSDESAAAGANAEQNVSAIQAEKERREAIGNLCKSNKIDSRVEARWIEDGTPLPQVAKEILDVMEERGKSKPAIASEIGLTTKERDKFSLFRVVRYLKDKGDADARSAAAFELECSKAVAQRLGKTGSSSVFVPAEVLMRPMSADVMQRAMATTPGSKGGYLVNVENMGFIDILRNRSVVRAMGARVISGLEGNVVFPRQTGKATVTWQGGEHTSVSATDQALGQLSMTPKTAIVVTDISEQLMRQSSPSAEQFVMADLAAVVAIDGVDAAAINGTGGAQPLGLKNTTGISSSQDAASVTYAKVLAFPVAAGGNNAIRGNPGFVTNIAGASVLMQKSRFSNTDTPLWEGNLLDGSLVGFRAMSSEQIGSGELIFGSWDELVIGEWGVLELATDTGGTRFNSATVGIRAMWMVDVMLRYPQAFVSSVNLSA